MQQNDIDVMRAVHQGDVRKVNKWILKGEHRNWRKLHNVLSTAASLGKTDICHLILLKATVRKSVLMEALNVACSSCNLSTAQLLASYCDIANNSEYMHKLLIRACAFGHAEILHWLITGVMKISYTDIDGLKWLLAFLSGHRDLGKVRQLATLLGVERVGIMSRALIIACYNSRYEVAKWLTTYTAANASIRQMYVINEDCVTSLMLTCVSGQLVMLRELLPCVTPFTVNVASGRRRDTALHLAIWCTDLTVNDVNLLFTSSLGGDIESVSRLLFSVNVNVQDSNGSTPLHHACAAGHVDIVCALVSVFADTDITDDIKHTAAQQAEYVGNSELVQYLRQLLPSNTESPPTNNDPTQTSNSANDEDYMNEWTVQRRSFSCDRIHDKESNNYDIKSFKRRLTV